MKILAVSVLGLALADALRWSLDDAIKRFPDHFDRYKANLGFIAGK